MVRDIMTLLARRSTGRGVENSVIQRRFPSGMDARQGQGRSNHMARNELIQSLLRAVDVLELVAQTDRGMTLAEVCTALDMKSSTVHNILRTLVARDIVE